MVKDIKASPLETIIEPSNGITVIDYLPPHPFRGMAYHRYPLFVFQQPPDTWLESRPWLSPRHDRPNLSKYAWENINRDTFSLRAWANQMGMKPVGAHLLRCEWDEHVPEILSRLGIPERAFKKIKSQETSPFDF